MRNNVVVFFQIRFLFSQIPLSPIYIKITADVLHLFSLRNIHFLGLDNVKRNKNFGCIFYPVSCFRRSLFHDRTSIIHLDACCRLDKTSGINYNAQLLGFPSGITASLHSNAALSKHHAAFSPPRLWTLLSLIWSKAPSDPSSVGRKPCQKFPLHFFLLCSLLFFFLCRLFFFGSDCKENIIEHLVC